MYKQFVLVLFAVALLKCTTTKIETTKSNSSESSNSEVKRIIGTLASDEMGGRANFTPSLEKAADFIAAEFKAVGLNTLSDGTYKQYFEMRGKKACNVVGILPGTSLKEEIVIFSAHYDHLGIENTKGQNDSIYNGANDDASGVTAVIELAKFYQAQKQNKRTIIFTAFAAEEIGGFGSKFFSKQYNPDKVMAMFNIEMIGTESKWGKNSAYITGFDKSDMGKILQENLKGSVFTFYPDPYPSENLFYRSDNKTLAMLGVPAHTISTAKMDAELHYHKVSDEVATLDLDNLSKIISAIALSATSIVDGRSTPTRVSTSR